MLIFYVFKFVLEVGDDLIDCVMFLQHFLVVAATLKWSPALHPFCHFDEYLIAPS